MAARLRLTLLLLLAVVVATGLLWQANRPAPPSGADESLAGVAVAEIERIVINRTGRDDVILERSPQGWKMAAPYHLPASPFFVEHLLALAASRPVSRFAVTADELASYGLDHPGASLHVGNGSLHLGDREPLGGHRYALWNDQVLLVDEGLYALLRQDAARYADDPLLSDDVPPESIEPLGLQPPPQR